MRGDEEAAKVIDDAVTAVANDCVAGVERGERCSGWGLGWVFRWCSCL